MLNTFLRNTTDSCENICRSGEQRKEKMLLQNMQRYPTDWWALSCFKLPQALAQYLKNLKAQHKSQILHYLEGWNTPPTASSHSRTCWTVPASNYWEPETCEAWEEHHLKATRAIKKGDRRLRIYKCYIETIFPASLLNPYWQKWCWRKGTKRRETALRERLFPSVWLETATARNKTTLHLGCTQTDVLHWAPGRRKGESRLQRRTRLLQGQCQKHRALNAHEMKKLSSEGFQLISYWVSAKTLARLTVSHLGSEDDIKY